MIIWGSVGRESVLGIGEFFCPQCGGTSEFNHIRISRYFTLYFIPLFQTSVLGEIIRCMACRQNYRMEVLDYRPATSPGREQITQDGYRDHFQESPPSGSLPDPGNNQELQSLQAQLEGGLPLQTATQQLIDSGMEEEAARNLIQAARGPAQKFCVHCYLSYVDTVQRCSKCSRNL